MIKKAWVFVGLCLVPFLPLFSQQHNNTNIATSEPKFTFDKELYPSYILTVSGPREDVELPKDYIGDFYKIDPLLFSPAQVTINNLTSGKSYRAGHLNAEVLGASLLGLERGTSAS